MCMHECDTVDHKILLSRLQYHLGIHDIALDWCKSYLLNRPQHVCIGNAISKPVILDYSVPQGSVLGPPSGLLFIHLRFVISF